MAKLSHQFGVEFPKGAGANVDQLAKEFVESHGAAELVKVSKTHFRTALRAQGLPEPPKMQWRQR
jgi:ribonuclease HIII